MTIVEKILIAGYKLEQKGKSPFIAEDLIVATWENDKGSFGLQGYSEKFPDSNRILTNVMGTKGLRGKGWIEKTGEKLYRLTPLGIKTAKALLGLDDIGASRAGNVPREQLQVIKRLMESPIFASNQSAADTDVIFRDACRFWGISSYSTAATLKNRFVEIKDTLDTLRKIIEANKGHEVVLPSMKIRIDSSVIQRLQDLHVSLQEKFFNELENIRQRDDERKI